ncbi:hypothetical protein BU26DRAFT_135040 [Trematosphaeria pertusa]|uniref:Uncharacterized protein n=1 Tax=Trematosphaeria pertusa TaxID=390896 RepID=A0A6A6IVE4_9PLEO|nr:uncharacterized protein BU26DRAFT_135040 [Trematosphaeria pertusa]KAF2254218.1 hypothetical protein BU26DRAFT_135040 [Trematosphaeria pertusa]
MPHPLPSISMSPAPRPTTTTPPRSSRRTVTPPNPATPRLPLSPPRSAAPSSPRKFKSKTRNALLFVRSLYNGRRQLQCIRRFRLSPDQFALLQDAIFGDLRLGNWARDKLRWSYNSYTEDLVFRMASPLHEAFVEGLRALLQRKIADLRQDNATSDGARKSLDAISSGGSPVIGLGMQDTIIQRAPDISFLHQGARGGRPPFVSEIAVSQDGKAAFPAIAEQYLLATRGKIRTFLGVDIEYRDTQARWDTSLPPRWATYYVCRFETQRGADANGDPVDIGVAVASHEGTKFHDKTGVVSASSTISFSLCDFCPRRRSDATATHPTIDITHQELADVLASAEAAQRARDTLPAAATAHTDADDDLPSPAAVQYRFTKRAASKELDEDTEEDTTVADDEFSSFEANPQVKKPALEPRESLPRRVKKKTSQRRGRLID